MRPSVRTVLLTHHAALSGQLGSMQLLPAVLLYDAFCNLSCVFKMQALIEQLHVQNTLHLAESESQNLTVGLQARW